MILNREAGAGGRDLFFYAVVVSGSPDSQANADDVGHDFWKLLEN